MKNDTSQNLRGVRVGPKILNTLREEYYNSLEQLWLGPTFSSAVTIASIADCLPFSLLSLDLDLTLIADRRMGHNCPSAPSSMGVDWAREMDYCMKKLPPSLETLCLRLPTRQDGVATTVIQALVSVISEGGLSGLKTLDLRRNKIDDDGALLLSNAMPHVPLLRNLVLSGNRIGSEGATALAKAINPSQLEQLDLCHNHLIDDAALTTLSQALQTNDHLKILNITGCLGVSKAGVRTLLECLRLHNVTLEKFHWKERRPIRHDPRAFVAPVPAALEQNTNVACSPESNDAKDNDDDDKKAQTQDEILQSIDYWLSLNRAGRRLLTSSRNQTKVPVALWPHILAKKPSNHSQSLHDNSSAKRGPHELYFLLQQSPWLFGSTDSTN